MNHNYPSLSLCKELDEVMKAKGKKVEAEMYWDYKDELIHQIHLSTADIAQSIPAPSIAENWDALPAYVSCYRTDGDNWVCETMEGATIEYVSNLIWADTLANAVCKMRIYLETNNLI